jgi:hypothetical protein
MAKMKYKWKVSSVPTGRYRSFEKRCWPSAEYADGSFAAEIYCEDSYEPWRVKCGEHKPLELLVRDFSSQQWKKVRAVNRYATLPEAKAALEKIFEQYPHLQKEIPSDD